MATFPVRIGCQANEPYRVRSRSAVNGCDAQHTAVDDNVQMVNGVRLVVLAIVQEPRVRWLRHGYDLTVQHDGLIRLHSNGWVYVC